MPTVMESLRIEGNRPCVKPISPTNTPVSLSEPNLSTICDNPVVVNVGPTLQEEPVQHVNPQDTLNPTADQNGENPTPAPHPTPRDGPLSSPRDQRDTVPTVHITTTAPSLQQIPTTTPSLQQIARQENINPPAVSGASVVVRRAEQLARVKQIAAGYHPEANIVWAEQEFGGKEKVDLTLSGRAAIRESERGQRNTFMTQLPPSNNRDAAEAANHLKDEDDKKKDADDGDKGKEPNAVRNDGTASRSFVLPSLTFGAQKVKSAGDYYGSEHDDLASHLDSTYTNGSETVRNSGDVDVRLLKRRRFTKRCMSTERETPPPPVSTRELRMCLNINPTGSNNKAGASDDDIKFRHHTQFMQKKTPKYANNPYQQMLRQNRPAHRHAGTGNAPIFDSVDSYLCFNKNKSEGKMGPVLLQASRMNGQSVPNRAYSDTHLLRMIFEMNRPKSRLKSARMPGCARSMEDELGEYLRVNTPKLDRKVVRRVPKSARSLIAPAPTVVREETIE